MQNSPGTDFANKRQTIKNQPTAVNQVYFFMLTVTEPIATQDDIGKFRTRMCKEIYRAVEVGEYDFMPRDFFQIYEKSRKQP